MMGYEAGLKPDELNYCSLNQLICYIAAYRKRGWQQTRLVAYIQYCTATDPKKRESIYEFLPLPGDPTAEEIRQMKQDEVNRKYMWLQQSMERFRRAGLIK